MLDNASKTACGTVVGLNRLMTQLMTQPQFCQNINPMAPDSCQIFFQDALLSIQAATQPFARCVWAQVHRVKVYSF